MSELIDIYPPEIPVELHDAVWTVVLSLNGLVGVIAVLLVVALVWWWHQRHWWRLRKSLQPLANRAGQAEDYWQLSHILECALQPYDHHCQPFVDMVALRKRLQAQACELELRLETSCDWAQDYQEVRHACRALAGLQASRYWRGRTHG